MNNTYFGAIHLDMKLDYTISRIFQEKSLSELETLHQLCELERTQILQSLALAVLKIPNAGYLLDVNSHINVKLNPDEEKYYLLTPYPTLMQSLKKFSSESIRAIIRNPNIDLQSIGIYSKSDMQHHILTQQFQELLTQMDPIQRQSID